MTLSCAQMEELFSRRFDERLSSVEAARFEGHLSSCTSCETDYSRYDSLFRALMEVPVLRTDLAPPMPTESAAFASGSATGSKLSRWVSVAGVLLLLAGVGKLAFDYGRTTLPESPDGDLPAAAVVAQGETAPDEIRWPEADSGRRLRRVVDNTENLYRLSEVGLAKRADHPKLAQTISSFVNKGPMSADLAFLRSRDAARDFGTFRKPVVQLTQEVDRLLTQVNRAALAKGAARARLQRIHQLLENSGVRARSRQLEPVLRAYEPIREEQRELFFEPKESGMTAFDIAFLDLSFGRTDLAVRRFQSLLAHEEADMRLSTAYFLLTTGMAKMLDPDAVPEKFGGVFDFEGDIEFQWGSGMKMGFVIQDGEERFRVEIQEGQGRVRPQREHRRPRLLRKKDI